jgi:hypothetical protein
MAANTGIYHGSDMLLYVGGTAIGHATSHDLDVKSEIIVRRTKDTGKFPTRKLTGIDASASCKALVLYDGYSFKDLLTAQLAGTPLTLTMRGHSNATWGIIKQVGDWYIQMPALVSNNSLSASQNEDGSYTVSFDLNGALEIKTET